MLRTIPKRPSNRRKFLRAAGITLALPLLDAWQPCLRAGQAPEKPPRRMVCICSPLGLHPASFFPEQAGRDYQLSPYLEPLQELRDEPLLIVREVEIKPEEAPGAA